VKVKEHDDGSNCYCFVFSEVSEWAFYYGLLNSRPHVLGMSLQVNKCIQAMYWIYLNIYSVKKKLGFKGYAQSV
jgi:hypothetical protein